ncbi:MAG: SO_0444 family Cu/Zn efflux transporter [Planctomycetaceae bacterium]|nr:SO_0444 family Cu/Zn efflux transporter [Planctomycetaceae bacterium]
MSETLYRIASSAWGTWLELAPWLCVGLIFAGLMKALFPNHLVRRWLGGSGIVTTIKAALIGTPLPLCSCSVLPAAIQLHRSGASKSSTIAFLIATPENGADSLSMSWGLLGPAMTLVRLASALISSVTAGLLCSILDKSESSEVSASELSGQSNQEVPEAGACCHSELPTDKTQEKVLQPTSIPGTGLLAIIEPPAIPNRVLHANESQLTATDHTAAPVSKSCCATQPVEDHSGVLSATLAGIRYAFDRLLSDIAHWVFIGVLTAAIVQELVPANAFSTWGSGPWTMLAVLAISVPTYVCATASTPIGAAMLGAGLSPGTVLVFLLAGPASNFSSAGIVRRELGQRSMLAYLFGVIGITLALGLTVDWAFPGLGNQARQHVHTHESFIPHWIAVPIAAVLGMRMIWAIVIRQFRSMG